MDITIVLRITPGFSAEFPVQYDDDLIDRGATLSDFRRKFQVQCGNALFVQPSYPDATADVTSVHNQDEGAYRISEFVPGSRTKAKIVMWSHAYAEAEQSDGWVRIVFQGRPNVLKWTTQRELEAMTLADLRRRLVEWDPSLDEDRFQESGIPVDRGAETKIDAFDIVDCEARPKTLRMATAQAGDNAPTLSEEERWREALPALELTGSGEPRTGGGESALTMESLTASEQEGVLRNCGLYPAPLRPETSAALRFGDQEIEFGKTRYVRCGKVRVLPAGRSRDERVVVSNSEEEHLLRSRLVDVENLDFTFPLFLRLRAKRTTVNGAETLTKAGHIRVARLLALPKAEVVLDNVSLADDYLGRIRGLVDAGNPEGLVDALYWDGLYVATHFVIGAMIVGQSSTSVQSVKQLDDLEASFRHSIDGLFDLEHAVQFGSHAVTGSDGKVYAVEMRAVGGIGEAIDSPPGGQAGAAWLTSVMTKPLTWRVIGYKAHGIKPILEYFPPDLRSRSKALLRTYFERQLEKRQSRVAGGGGGDAWDDGEHVSFGGRVAACHVMLDQNIDSIQFEYETATGRATGPWHGNSRERKASFSLGATDEIVAVEVGWDQTIDHILFHTKSGDNNGMFLGRGRGARHIHVFQEPRIRGFHGRAGHFLDAIGVHYYDLRADLQKHRQSVLLSLEQYIYQ